MIELLLVVLVLCQAPAVPQKPGPAKRPSPKAAPIVSPCRKEIEPQLCERGWQLLEMAEAEAGGMNEPAMRAYSSIQLARAYALVRKPKAVSLLNDAFTESLAMPDDRTEKSMLQAQVLVSLAPLAPAQVLELLAQAVPSAREPALQALLSHFEKGKRFEQAMDIINRIARDSGFPYAAASSLMASLPADKAMERQQVFTAALNSFRVHPPDRTRLDMDDFPDLLLRYWHDLPVALVREAIDEVLNNADRNTDKDAPAMRITLGWSSGKAALDSWYDYRLFQFLPLLREIDPAAADSLLREHAAVAQQFDVYSQAGLPKINAIGLGTGYVPITYSEVKADPTTHPEEAMEAALARPNPQARANYLLGFARRTAQKNPTTAAEFLRKLVNTVAPEIERPRERGVALADAATIYLQIGDRDGVQTAVAAGVPAVEKLYAEDADPSKPNKALKAFWPSTNAWIRFVRLAGRISPDMALGIIKDVRDDDIRPILRIALAGAWVGAPLGPLTIINKSGGFSQNDDPETRR